MRLGGTVQASLPRYGDIAQYWIAQFRDPESKRGLDDILKVLVMLKIASTHLFRGTLELIHQCQHPEK